MSQVSADKIKLFLEGNTLKAVTPAGESRCFAFPAVATAFNGMRIEAKTQVSEIRQLADGSLQTEFTDGSCRFKITVTPGSGNWFFKQVEISSDSALPTPDYVEVDYQTQHAEGLECRGYLCTISEIGEETNAEQGSGVSPGCGYPLVGKDLFCGIEHPAAYNSIVSEENGMPHWRLRHFPVWENGKIISRRAVFGIGDNAIDLLWKYIDTIRVCNYRSPLVAFCSFWSDPYAGNQEYVVTRDNHISLVDGFSKLDLKPEIYTLDAGWQDRKSFLRAKECYGGEEGLMEIGEKIRSAGSDFSLWVSPNGPVGIAMDFFREQGIAVGTGASCHYSYGEYGILLDEKLEKELTERACDLVKNYGVTHFKVDWDNECATNADFTEKYPSRNHVREASINMMARINRAAREINPNLKTRNGRWPSPWHLMLTSHLSLPSGGDCEYADAPSLSQRDAASTHRDFIYWCVFCRDKSVLPLDVLDNHEFGHSIRNPFQESPGSWSNACVWALMRGSSYHQYTLMPESLEDYQADILRRTIELLRQYPEKILTGRSKMFGDNPLAGSIYGFIHPSADGSSIVALRNSAPFPLEYELPSTAPYYVQSYPDCRVFEAGEKVVFAPHEVKILNGKSVKDDMFAEPCQLLPAEDGKYHRYLCASTRPDVLPIHQIRQLEKRYYNVSAVNGNLEITCGVNVPWRMRDFKMYLKISSKDCPEIAVRTSRFQNCRESSYAVPLTEVPAGLPGSGERKNTASLIEQTDRYFTADLPQGGNVYFCIILKNTEVMPENIELWVSGYEAPARKAEPQTVSEPDILLPLPHPSGFPLNLKLI